MSPRSPLVAPADTLTPAELVRYDRHLLLPQIGPVGQRRLKNARVLVVGAGGLGSPALAYLAAAGVGVLGVVDDDVVEASNLQRQIVHTEADLGRAKVDSAAEAVAGWNPLVRVRRHRTRLTAANALELVSGYDLVLDGTDNFPTRYLVNDACVLAGVPLVWGSIYRFDGQVSVFWAGHGPCYRCLFPAPPPPGSVPGCAEGGVLGVLCAAVGAAQATEAVKLVTGAGDPLVGRLALHDALAASWQELAVVADPGCAVCGTAPTITTATITTPTIITPGPDGSSGATGDEEAATLDPGRLRDWLSARDRGERRFTLVDVREPAERSVSAIEGSVGLPLAELESALEAGAGLPGVPLEEPVVLYCRSGGRSAAGLRALRGAGYADLHHLDGGILAWHATSARE